MKILIISQYFWPEEFRINDMVRGLTELGHEITVLTGIPNYPRGKYFSGYSPAKLKPELYYGARIVRVPILSRGSRRGLRLALNYISYAVSGCLMGPLLCRDDYDILFVCQYSPVSIALPGVLLKKMRHIPLIMWIQDLWPESITATGAVNSAWVLKQVDRLVDYIYRYCDKLWIQSRAFESLLETRGIEKNKISYLPNWAEDIYTAGPEGDREIVALPEGFRVLFAGNIGVAQDFPTILDAAERLKSYADIQWLVLGDGSDFTRVQQEVVKRGLVKCFHLLGRYPICTMPWFFSQADALLVTLKETPIFALTIPSKVQSYLACGRPLIAALSGEGSRIVKASGAGLVTEPENATGLAGRVLELCRMDKEARDEMGNRGRLYYEQHFKRGNLIARAEQLMKTAINEVHADDR